MNDIGCTLICALYYSIDSNDAAIFLNFYKQLADVDEN